MFVFSQFDHDVSRYAFLFTYLVWEFVGLPSFCFMYFINSGKFSVIISSILPFSHSIYSLLLYQIKFILNVLPLSYMAVKFFFIFFISLFLSNLSLNRDKFLQLFLPV